MIKIFTKASNEGEARKTIRGFYNNKQVKVFSFHESVEVLRSQGMFLPYQKSQRTILEEMFQGICKGDILVLWKADKEVYDLAYGLLKNYIGKVDHGDGFTTFTITRSPYETRQIDKSYRQHSDNRFNA